MLRRDLLRSLGASMALAMVPREAAAVWERVAQVGRPEGAFNPRHLALVEAIAESIIPATDTPGANDVNVAAFVDVIVNENYRDDERAAFLVGLDALDGMAWALGAPAFVALAPDARSALLDRIESAEDRSVQPHRTYWRLKGLVVHGYFTSEPVMKNVLQHQVMPGKFDGNAPMPGAILAGKPGG